MVRSSPKCSRTSRSLSAPTSPRPPVPIDAVIREGDLAAVRVESEPTLFRRRNVKLGMEQEGRVQIREGLAVGERIAARGAIYIDNQWRQRPRQPEPARRGSP